MKSKKIVFQLIVLVFIMISGCATDIKIKKYYKLVTSAEDAIVKGQLDKASKKYKRAFCKAETPFYRDARNSLILEIERGKNTSLIEKYGLALFDNGFSLTTDSSDALFPYLHKSKYYETLEIIFNQQIQNNKDSAHLNKELSILRDLDQSIRNYCAIKNKGETYHESCLDTIKYTDSLIQERLIQTLKKIDHNTKSSLTQRSIMTIDLVVMHSFQWNKFPSEEIYRSLVKNGYLDARDFAFTVDNKSVYPYSQTDTLTGQSGAYGNNLGFQSGELFFITHGNTETFKFDLGQVNLNRSEVYLDDIYDELNRCAWSVICADQPYKFSYTWSIPAYEGFPTSYIKNIQEMHLPIVIIEKATCNCVDSTNGK